MKDKKKRIIGIIILLSVLLGSAVLIGGIWNRIEPLVCIGKATLNTLEDAKTHLTQTYPLTEHSVWKSDALQQELVMKDFAMGAEDKGMIDWLMGDMGIALEVKTSGDQVRGKVRAQLFEGVDLAHEFYKDATLTAVLGPETNGTFQVVERKLKYTPQEKKTLINPLLKIFLKEVMVVELDPIQEVEDSKRFKVYVSDQGVKQILDKYMHWLLSTVTLKEHLYLNNNTELSYDEIEVKLEQTKESFSEQIQALKFAKGIEFILVINDEQKLVSGECSGSIVTEGQEIEINMNVTSNKLDAHTMEVMSEFDMLSNGKSVKGNSIYKSIDSDQNGDQRDLVSISIEQIGTKPITLTLQLVTNNQKQEAFGLDLAFKMGDKIAFAVVGEGIINLSNDQIDISMPDAMVKLVTSLTGIEFNMLNADINYQANRIGEEELKPLGLQ